VTEFLMRLHVFGGLWLDRCGDPHAGTRSRRGLACLALLAVKGDEGMPRRRAAALLWPDQEPQLARRALNQLLYTLRQDLGAAVLAERETLRLDSRLVSSDVGDLLVARRHEDPATVAALYRGPFLDGFHLDQSGEFERWSEAERSRLHRVAGDAILALAAQAEAVGDAPGAIGWWRRRAELDPLEPAWAIRLMDALAVSGDRPAALRCAAAFQVRIHEVLELAPDQDVASCADRIRRHSVPPRPLVAAPQPDVVDTAALAVPPSTHAAVPPAARRQWLRRLAFASVTLALAGWGTRPAERGPVSPPATLRVAVSPFVYQGGDTTLAAFGDLAAGWISGGLLDTGGFEVVDPRGLSRRPGSRRSDSDLALARLAGANRLVHGRFSMTRDSLRVVLGVTGTADGRELDSLRLTTAAGADLAEVGRLLSREALAVLARSAPEFRR